MAIVKTVNSSSNKSCRLNISIKNKVFMISFSNSFDAVIFKTERNSLSDIFNFFNKVSALNTAEFLSG
ncbi:MAG: hypothetical protein U9N52_04795, partial [Campylobacterota bacterium]|nr:hypothetical protein [Campylobacterota bacterium]